MDRRYATKLGGLVLVHVLLVWLLPILPGQDLPQHLAYARIWMDYSNPHYSFHSFYLLPEHFEPYFTIYVILVQLGRFLSLGAATRLVYTVYVVGCFAALHVLAGACAPRSPRSSWSPLLGTVVVWSPIACMGFLSFFLCVPVFLLGWAFVLRQTGPLARRRELGFLIASAAVLASMHLMAAGTFVILTSLHALLSPSRRRWQAALAVLLTTATTLALWKLVGDLGLGQHPPLNVADALHRAFGLEFVTILFDLNWSDLPTKITYCLWSLLGPFRLGSVAVLAAAAIAATLAIRRGTARDSERPPFFSPGPARRTVLAFAILAWLSPWGMHSPTEITFIDLRLLTLSVAMGIALLDPALFVTPRSQTITAALGALLALHFGARAIAFNVEARPALALMREARPTGTLLSLSFHNRTDAFGKMFRLTHFLPMYYTILDGGISTQFWARYTDHLPIDYQRGMKPAQPNDWNPEQFSVDHLKDSDFVLLQAALDEDPASDAMAATRASRILQQRCTLVRCDGEWCLYRHPR